MENSSVTLEQLLLAVGSGDRRCFTALYQRLAPSVLGLAHAVVRDHAQAEEVAQEVFLDLWRTAPRYRPDKGTAKSRIHTALAQLRLRLR